MNINKKRGFTLIELVVAMGVLAILSAVSYPSVSSFIEQARIGVDINTLGTLNLSTAVYDKLNLPPNPFDDRSSKDGYLMELLVDEGLLDEKPEPQQKDVSFKWSFDKKVWFMEGFTMGNAYYSNSIKSYKGSETDVTVPKSVNGTVITQILQDAFNGKNITSVTFPKDSSINRIHARAFKDNNLTEIVFPDSIKRIDYGAFMNNDIVKITIGSKVELEGNVFRNNNKFKEIYESEGKKAGTYLYEGDNWILKDV